MMQRIKLSRVMETLSTMSSDTLFSFFYVSRSSGALKHYSNARLSSVHSAGLTINVITEGEAKPHKFHKYLLTAFNGMKVYL